MDSPLSQEKNIVKLFVYHLNIFIIILLWFLYPFRFSLYFLILGLCLFLIFSPIIIWQEYLEDIVSVSDQAIYLIFIYFSLLYLFDASTPYNVMLLFFFSNFNELIGITHNHNFFIFSVLFLLVFVKILPIKTEFFKTSETFKSRPNNQVFEYITKEKRSSKVFLIGLIIPIGAFVEEFIYRTLILSILINFLKLNLFLSLIIVAFVFGTAHLTSFKNWGFFFFTFISSIIYSIALIFLGILYAWILHLFNNLLALMFFYYDNK